MAFLAAVPRSVPGSGASADSRYSFGVVYDYTQVVMWLSTPPEHLWHETLPCAGRCEGNCCCWCCQNSSRNLKSAMG